MLRDLEPTTPGNYAGWIEISNAAAAESLSPSVLYQVGAGSWQEIATTASTVTATPGYTRFDVTLATTAGAAVNVVPFIHLAQGGRLFDHNRNVDDLANYALSSPDFSIWQDPTVCAAATGPTTANLVFDADYSQHRDGILAAGGQVMVTYANSRLSQCASTQGGLPQYSITAWLKFFPGDQLVGVNVLNNVPTVAVPIDASSVQVWFETVDVHGCHGYDSNSGANYEFDMMRAPQWIGNGTSLFNRDDSQQCGTTPIEQGFTFDTYVRERAVITNTCFEFYQPGVTDFDNPDLWKQYDVEIHIETSPTVWQSFPVNFESRQGNNARYAFDWRAVDPFREYFCTTLAVTPTSDGMYELAQLEYYITVNGGEYRPQLGAPFTGNFIDYLNATNAYCAH